MLDVPGVLSARPLFHHVAGREEVHQATIAAALPLMLEEHFARHVHVLLLVLLRAIGSNHELFSPFRPLLSLKCHISHSHLKTSGYEKQPLCRLTVFQDGFQAHFAGAPAARL